MQSRRRMRSSELSALLGRKVSVLFFIFLFFYFFCSGKGFGHLSDLGAAVSAGVSPLCPPVTQWLLRSSFLLPFSSLSFLLLLLLLLLLPSLPYPPDSVSFTATELSGQHQHWNLWRFLPKGNKREERERASVSPHLPSLARLQVFFPPPVFHLLLFFLIFDELVIAQGGRTARVAGGGRWGAGAVLQPSGMRDLVWEWWALPHPLLLVSFLRLCLQNCPPFSPAAPPFRPVSALWSHSCGGCGGCWFEWRLCRHGANGRSAGK